jgi:hypothetical protein
MIPMFQQGQFGRSILAVSAVVDEYIPTIAYALLGSDTSITSTSFATLLTVTIVTANTSDCINIVMSASGDVQSSGNTPAFQITVDGSDVGQTCTTQPLSGGYFACTRVVSVTGLSVGSHTVLLKWKGASANQIRIRPLADTPTKNHAALICRLATGTTYVTRGTNATSTSTTVTDSLLSTTHTSTLSTSALMVRFSACGVNNATRTAKFQLKVDGVAVGGTADSGDGAGFAFNAGMIVIVPVTSGVHTVDLNWAGGASTGSTITVSDPRQHAALIVEEVYTGSPRFDAFVNDTSVSVTTVASRSYTAPVGGFSDILIEATLNTEDAGPNGHADARLNIDGTTVSASSSGTTSNAVSTGTFITHVQTGLSAASHTVTFIAVQSGAINVATTPEYMHANMVIWPVDIQ